MDESTSVQYCFLSPTDKDNAEGEIGHITGGGNGSGQQVENGAYNEPGTISNQERS